MAIDSAEGEDNDQFYNKNHYQSLLEAGFISEILIMKHYFCNI